MKKLKLNLQNIEGAEVLSREQLKKVMGGIEMGSGIDGECPCGSECTAGPGGLKGKCTPAGSHPDGSQLKFCICTP